MNSYDKYNAVSRDTSSAAYKLVSILNEAIKIINSAKKNDNNNFNNQAVIFNKVIDIFDLLASCIILEDEANKAAKDLNNFCEAAINRAAELSINEYSNADIDKFIESIVRVRNTIEQKESY